MWRPRGLNESIPAAIGAVLVLISGTVSIQDLVQIAETISGAAITILATIVTAIVLESFGFFVYAAEFLANRAQNSGVRLFWYINLSCFLMTMLFNNDGSILIMTPILLILLRKLGLRPHQQIPYLLSGALIATASSAPIGVSNIVNLISLKIIGMNLDLFTSMMFIPAMLGLVLLLMLLFLYFRKELPADLKANRRSPKPRPKHNIEYTLLPEHEVMKQQHHPLHLPLPDIAKIGEKRKRADSAPNKVIKEDHSLLGEMDNNHRMRFMRNVFLYVIGIRVSLFVVAYFGISVSIAAVMGAVVLLVWRWAKLHVPPTDLIRKTPWHNVLFVFGMYIVIYGLYKIGMTTFLVDNIRQLATSGLIHASLTMGILVSVMSSVFNNHPALMIGTLTLTKMGFTPMLEKVAYLGNVVGSDIGSLLLPIGTLATLMWMHILKRNHISITWRKYLSVTVIVIPVTVLFTLVFLSFWVGWLF